MPSTANLMLHGPTQGSLWERSPWDGEAPRYEPQRERVWGDEAIEVPWLRQASHAFEQALQRQSAVTPQAAIKAVVKITKLHLDADKRHQPRELPHQAAFTPLDKGSGANNGQFFASFKRANAAIATSLRVDRALQAIAAEAYRRFFDGSDRALALHTLQQLQTPHSTLGQCIELPPSR